MEGHEDAGTALSGRAFATQTLDLPVRVNLVVLQDAHLDLLALVLDLFGCLRGSLLKHVTEETIWRTYVVCLLLTLLGTTTQTEHQMKSRLLLDVVIGQGASIFELLAGEDQALLVGRDPKRTCELGKRRRISLVLTLPCLESWL